MIRLNLFMIWFLHFLSLLSVICRYYRQNSSSQIIVVLVYTVSTLFLLVMYVYVRICSHCISIRNRVLLYVLFMIAINSMIEQHFMEFAYNPFYMAFSAKLIKST